MTNAEWTSEFPQWGRAIRPPRKGNDSGRTDEVQAADRSYSPAVAGGVLLGRTDHLVAAARGSGEKTHPTVVRLRLRSGSEPA